MSKYTDLITNYHHGKPLFVDHVNLSTRPLIDTASSLKGFLTEFDIDTAVGVQLDILGEWVGRSRVVGEPIAGVYFELDSDDLGYDQGVWQGPFDPDEGFTSLSDDVYRTVLKVKIAINQWDGSNESIPDILNAALENSGIRMAIIDNQNMAISIWVLSEPPSLNVTDRMIFDNSLNGIGFIPLPSGYLYSDYNALSIESASRELIAAIKQGYLTIKAAGINLNEIITPSEGYQFFGFDVDNDYISGFESGAWETRL